MLIKQIGKLQLRKKYSQYSSLTNDSHPEYVLNFPNSSENVNHTVGTCYKERHRMANMQTILCVMSLVIWEMQTNKQNPNKVPFYAHRIAKIKYSDSKCCP
jgi:hypothetical protein